MPIGYADWDSRIYLSLPPQPWDDQAEYHVWVFSLQNIVLGIQLRSSPQFLICWVSNKTRNGQKEHRDNGNWMYRKEPIMMGMKVLTLGNLCSEDKSRDFKKK